MEVEQQALYLPSIPRGARGAPFEREIAGSLWVDCWRRTTEARGEQVLWVLEVSGRVGGRTVGLRYRDLPALYLE